MDSGFEDLGFARLDTGRKERTGFPETVFCQGKEDSFLREIFKRLYEKNGEVLGTRASAAQFEVVKAVLPEVRYDAVSRLLTIQSEEKKQTGNIIVCSAGTADIPVAQEAAGTAEFFGCRVRRIFDAGVSGLHRLLAEEPVLKAADCVIAVAGMEGALPSVIGGLVSVPVIAVPTSVGYGANFGGVAALRLQRKSGRTGHARHRHRRFA